MSWAEILLIVSTTTSGVLIPIVLYFVAGQARARVYHFSRIEGRLDHLDSCIDSLRTQVVGSTATRGELKEVNDRLSVNISSLDLRQNEARHANNTHTTVLLNEIEDRLTRRVERLEESFRGS